MKNRKELIGNFLFFSKNEGKKITQKLNDILKNQKEIKDDITEIKQILKEYSKLEKSYNSDIKKIYKIINQLLLKDLLKKHKDLLDDIKNDNY
ncbi:MULTISPECIES: hypothetical protein [Leptotrichia]|jgi:hypothetical protein|uniref:hypothetical protein n=1 Tax=Leptotrichia TaxID=32067 RepID=UPI0015B9ADF3|nr:MULTISPECIES: hypothetical protein [Leptotrichia]NWO27570.1 hypothetical protein [Leptotrichia sp. oral taxon 417]